jgi:hypothetical protein
MRNILIIAPHIDDELIGCWSVFNNPENNISVVWLCELTDTRKHEGLTLKGLSVNGWIKASIDRLEFGQENVTHIIEGYKPEEVYVTSRKDSHIEHKIANSLFRKYATHFYSVDMVGARYIGEEESKLKRYALDVTFPSQMSLWATNAKYYLFESIAQCDFEYSSVIDYKAYHITVPQMYYKECIDALYEDYTSPDELMDFLLQRCPIGKVTVEYKGLILSSEG